MWLAAMQIYGSQKKKMVYIGKESNSHRICLEHQHGRRFIIGLEHQYGRPFNVLEHQYGHRDVMWKHSIVCSLSILIIRNLKQHSVTADVLYSENC